MQLFLRQFQLQHVVKEYDEPALAIQIDHDEDVDDYSNLSMSLTVVIVNADGEHKKVASSRRFVGSSFSLEVIKAEDLLNPVNRYLNNDVLTLEIEVCEAIRNEKFLTRNDFLKQFELLERSRVPPLPNAGLNLHLEKLLNIEEFSDFVFVCSDKKKIHVIKGILAIQCPAFAAMIATKMKENKTNEAHIDDIDSKTMFELLRFLYCRRVENLEDCASDLLVAANKYGIADLEKICASKLMETFETVGYFEVLILADLTGAHNLKQFIIDYIKW